MYRKLLFTLCLVLAGQTLSAQISFIDETSNLNDSNLKSGVAIAIADMNNDGLDDVVRLSNATNLAIEFQQPDGSFNLLAIGNMEDSWGITIADIDENGYNDVVAGGYYNGLQLAIANNDGSAYTIVTLTGPSIFLQNANFADINNDGSIDLFACHDEGMSTPYEGDGQGHLTYNLDLIETPSTTQSDNSGNYGSIWTDYDNDGDLDLYISKCRIGVSDPNDGRRRNLLFQNDGSNNYTDVAEDAGLLPLAQSWSANFEDIDNDGDFDCVMINHDISSQIYENNGDGTFTDITAESGVTSELASLNRGIQVMMEDFDNDGFIDMFLSTRDGDHQLLLNDGDLTFTSMNSAFPNNTPRIQSGAVGDMNNDGFIDLLAGHATGYNNPSDTPDQLFINQGNDNNWSRIRLVGVESNKDAIGAKVELHGAWGMQLREVRAGESYGTQNSIVNHFGIGTETAIDKVTIHWPSGLTEEYLDIDTNETITYVEGVGELGIEDNATAQFVMYPNPAGDILNLYYNSNMEGMDVQIFDLNGREVLQNNLVGVQQSSIDVSSLETGVYFVSVNNGVVKLIKR